MTKFNDVALVGPFMSCEIDTHVQTWCGMFDTRMLDTILVHMQASCAPEMKWTDTVMISEVELSLAVLNRGLSLASFVPDFERFTIHHRLALQNDVTEITDKLNGCRNPAVDREVSPDHSFLSQAVFIKYGGQVWRNRLHSLEYDEVVFSNTAKVLNLKETYQCSRNRGTR